MKIINPTDKEISVVIKGTSYTLPASGFIPNVPDQDAEDWQTKTHQFIKLEKDVVEKTDSELKDEVEKVKQEIEEVKKIKDIVEKESDKKESKQKDKNKSSKK